MCRHSRNTAGTQPVPPQGTTTSGTVSVTSPSPPRSGNYAGRSGLMLMLKLMLIGCIINLMMISLMIDLSIGSLTPGGAAPPAWLDLGFGFHWWVRFEFGSGFSLDQAMRSSFFFFCLFLSFSLSCLSVRLPVCLSLVSQVLGIHSTHHKWSNGIAPSCSAKKHHIIGFHSIFICRSIWSIFCRVGFLFVGWFFVCRSGRSVFCRVGRSVPEYPNTKSEYPHNTNARVLYV